LPAINDLHQTMGMKVVVIARLSRNDSRSQQLLVDLERYNEALIDAGILLAAEHVTPGLKGARVKISSGRHTSVIDGPFVETKELVGGFWVWDVESLDEAVEWARRAPAPPGEDLDLEILPLVETEQ
jgi:hypothetical protein